MLGTDCLLFIDENCLSSRWGSFSLLCGSRSTIYVLSGVAGYPEPVEPGMPLD